MSRSERSVRSCPGRLPCAQIALLAWGGHLTSYYDPNLRWLGTLGTALSGTDEQGGAR